MRTELGKIIKTTFGWGGYQEVMIGVTFWLGGESWGVQDFRGYWGNDRTATTQWTEEDRIAELGKMCLSIRTILQEAKKQTLADLAGTPIEATFDGNKLVSWRVLKEVL